MLGLVILVIHPSDAVARSVGLVGFAGLAFVLYAGGRILAAERRFASVVGLVCAAAGATAGGILMFAPTVILDVPAAALLASGLSYYFVLLGLAVASSFVVEGQWYRRLPDPEARARRGDQVYAAAVLVGRRSSFGRSAMRRNGNLFRSKGSTYAHSNGSPCRLPKIRFVNRPRQRKMAPLSERPDPGFDL